MPKSSDEVIKKDVVDELYWDNRTDASNINVTVDNGVVELNGEVPSYREVIAAGDAAWRMRGVIDVLNNLTVSAVAPPAVPDDQEIEARASNVLAWEPAIDDADITVSVVNGLVILEGAVNAYWKKSYVESCLATLKGVVAVDNQLVVTPLRSYYDEAIAEDIMEALRRDPLVDPNEITVEVLDGVVTLTGTVSSGTARRAANDDAAYTEGVIDIRNELVVLP